MDVDFIILKESLEPVDSKGYGNRQDIVSFSDITCAAFLIRNHVMRTPCTVSIYAHCAHFYSIDACVLKEVKSKIVAPLEIPFYFFKC